MVESLPEMMVTGRNSCEGEDRSFRVGVCDSTMHPNGGIQEALECGSQRKLRAANRAREDSLTEEGGERGQPGEHCSSSRGEVLIFWYHSQNILKTFRSWKDTSTIQRSSCSSRGPEFKSR